MTTREPQQLLDLFLEEGPAVLPDRVLEAVRDDIHGQRQRVVIGPWRFRTMRTYLAAAAVVVVVAIGGGLMLATRGFYPTVGATPQPSVIATPSEVFTSYLPDGTATAALKAGSAYKISDFVTPFSFSIPASAGPGLVSVRLLNSDNNSVNIQPTMGGAVTIHDLSWNVRPAHTGVSARIPNDLCHPSGIQDYMGSSVDGYLRASSPDMTVSPMRSLGSVHYWDIVLGPRCYVGDEPPRDDPTVWFQAGEHHRVYAISLGIRTLIAFTWGTGYRGEGDEMLQQINPIADALVQTIKPIQTVRTLPGSAD